MGTSLIIEAPKPSRLNGNRSRPPGGSPSRSRGLGRSSIEKAARAGWSRASAHCSGGQSVVEFALVLPLLLLVVLIGLDFGRSFFGWVGLSNSAGIAANYASLHPDAWGAPGHAIYQAEYDRLVTDDFQNAGCAAPSPIPPPTFLDGGSTALLAHVSVSLSCQLPLVTPLIGSFFPSGVPITGYAVFAVRGGIITGGGSGGGLTPSAAFTPSPASGLAPLTVTFSNTTTGTVTNWYWDFGDNTASTVQNPGPHVYTTAQTYTVMLSATNTNGTSHASASITVGAPPVLTAGFSWFPASPGYGQPVAFTGTASGGTPGYTWSWVFGDGGTSTAQSPTHTYATAGTFTVKLTVKDATNATSLVTDSIVVVSATCIVPNLIGVETSQAQRAWNDAGFKTNVNFNPAQPPQYRIVTQEATSGSGSGSGWGPGSSLPCDTAQMSVTK